MITNLTAEQRARFPEFVDKWTKIGLSTEPADRQKAEDGIKKMYVLAGLRIPHIVWCESPLANGLARAIISARKAGASVRDLVWDSVGDSVWDSVWDSVRASVGDSVWDSVWDSVRASVRASVRDSVWDSVRASVRASVGASVRDLVWDSVRDSVRASVWDSVRDLVWDLVWDSVGASVWDSVGASVRASVWDSVGASVRDLVRASGYGQHDANWLAFYDYFSNVCNLEKPTEKLAGHWLQAQSAGWYLPHEKICWVSERHNVLKLNKQGRLHCEKGMALAYPDGWGIYSLNGVRMKPEYVLTPAEKLDIKTIMNEENTRVRMELIKKVGKERLLEVSDVVDTWGKYKLLDMRKVLMSASYEPHLYMVNPSTGEIHCEGVAHECKTVEQAIQWGYPEAVRNTPIDEKNGKGFFQQGDVIIWEEGMVTRQKYPIILT